MTTDIYKNLLLTTSTVDNYFLPISGTVNNNFQPSINIGSDVIVINGTTVFLLTTSSVRLFMYVHTG
jgi:hypothetical protein